MSVKINVRETPNAVILEATGRITLGPSGPSLQDGIRELLDSGHKNIILDLGGITFLDSSGLGQLVGSYATAVSRGGQIRLLNLNKRIYDLMQITKLYTVFAIYTDETTAVKSFEAAAVSA
jgi:anti-sigma B factor antagonist